MKIMLSGPPPPGWTRSQSVLDMIICILTVNCCCKYSIFLSKVLLSTQAVYLERKLLSPRDERHFLKVKGVQLILMKKEENHNGREHCVLEYYSIKYMYSGRNQTNPFQKNNATKQSGAASYINRHHYLALCCKKPGWLYCFVEYSAVKH